MLLKQQQKERENNVEDIMGRQFKEMKESEKFMYFFVKDGERVVEYCKNQKQEKITESVKNRESGNQICTSNYLSIIKNEGYRQYDRNDKKIRPLSLTGDNKDNNDQYQQQLQEIDESQQFMDIHSKFQFLSTHNSVSNSMIKSSKMILVVVILMFLLVVLGNEIGKKQSRQKQELKLKIEECRQDYIDNLCEPITRRPVLDNYCNELFRCMQLQPEMETSQINSFAQIIADFINILLQQLELKTYFVVFLTILIYLYFKK